HPPAIKVVYMAINVLKSYFSLLSERRILVMILLGFSSGLPLALTGGTLEAWFAHSGASYKTIGWVTLVGQPYIYKFLWAPLVDRYVWPFLGHRRGWMMVTQLLLLGTIACMAFFDPLTSGLTLALIALVAAFVSATQDISVDAYRAEILKPEERGLGAAVFVGAYRMALVVSGGVAMLMADQIGWRDTYIIMAGLMAIGIIATLISQEPTHKKGEPHSLKEAFLQPLVEFLQRPMALWLLAVIVFYKFGDAFIAKMFSAFLIGELGFTLTDVGSVLKIGGLFASVCGAITAGLFMVRMRLFTALVVFGILQAISNLMFLLLALIGKDYTMMTVTVVVEQFCGGLGTAAFLALLMSLCNARFTATQFTLLAALSAVGRESLGPLAGYLVEHFGWTIFFVTTFIASFPGLIILFVARKQIEKYQS
ncbi:MAG TPA: MFS transporter, partial [Gammaproteobacteria bacterium]|nr:MFS transporter [Gammaproteobacteria bacterium]